MKKRVLKRGEYIFYGLCTIYEVYEAYVAYVNSKEIVNKSIIIPSAFAHLLLNNSFN